jgi:hypothetical protein
MSGDYTLIGSNSWGTQTISNGSLTVGSISPLGGYYTTNYGYSCSGCGSWVHGGHSCPMTYHTWHFCSGCHDHCHGCGSCHCQPAEKAKPKTCCDSPRYEKFDDERVYCTGCGHFKSISDPEKPAKRTKKVAAE